MQGGVYPFSPPSNLLSRARVRPRDSSERDQRQARLHRRLVTHATGSPSPTMATKASQLPRGHRSASPRDRPRQPAWDVMLPLDRDLTPHVRFLVAAPWHAVRPAGHAGPPATPAARRRATSPALTAAETESRVVTKLLRVVTGREGHQSPVCVHVIVLPTGYGLLPSVKSPGEAMTPV